MKVPFFDWRRLYTAHADLFRSVIDTTLSQGRFILQQDVIDLERRLESMLKVKHAIAVSDATNAMLLGFRAAELSQGDEVILSSHAFLAAAQSIHHAGGVPVPVEIGNDWMTDPAAVERAITKKTRFIMAVQVNGRTCDMDEFGGIAARNNIRVVEDSAQALGARYKSGFAGTFGLWGVFSFYPSKTLGGFGDGGALVTSDDEIARRVRMMRNHGAGEDKTIRADVTLWGTNSRLDNVHAAVLNTKLDMYNQAIARRRAIASRYDTAFRKMPQLALPPSPGGDKDRFDVFQNYELEADDRDALRAHLDERGIGTIIQWGGIAIHRFRGLGFCQEFPRVDRFFERCLLLPMNELLTDEEVDYVIEGVQSFYE